VSLGSASCFLEQAFSGEPSMKRNLLLTFAAVVIASSVSARADVVLDWNLTMRQVINDVPETANPGISTRSIGMMNAAIYDVFQSFDRTHQPFKVYKTADAGASLEAAVARAARDILADCYPEPAAVTRWTDAYNDSMIGIPVLARQLGEDLGAAIAAKYIQKHANDGWDNPGSYTSTPGPGNWSSDPYWMDDDPDLDPEQAGWGPGWGDVKPWVMQNSDQFDGVLADIGGLDLSSSAYAAAYNQVLNYGAKTVYGPGNTPTSRSPDQTNIGQFWGYDVPSFGPPPVLFLKNLEEIATQTGNTEAENARLFAMASVAMADAAIAAWDVKFETDFWRPVTAIHAAGNGTAGDADGNAGTLADPDWRPLGAPGHGIISPDFTPPFPAYTSGHATMGGALFKALQLFYGKNEFEDITGIPGDEFELTSDELPGAAGVRSFKRFTVPDLLAMAADLDPQDSPEAENAISRIFLGIHWIFDATDGVRLGNAIADYAATNHFLAVPEPNAVMLVGIGCMACASVGRRRRR
jgi:hypothetical protein